jgi:hypothetical protein
MTGDSIDRRTALKALGLAGTTGLAGCLGDGGSDNGDNGGTDTAPEYSTSDHRDRAVLERLEPGAVVTMRELRSLYRQHTDIKSKETLVERLRSLTDRSDLQSVARRKYRFVPEASE